MYREPRHHLSSETFSSGKSGTSSSQARQGLGDAAESPSTPHEFRSEGSMPLLSPQLHRGVKRRPGRWRFGVPKLLCWGHSQKPALPDSVSD